MAGPAGRQLAARAPGVPFEPPRGRGFRHSKKTWMIEDGTPEILAETCLGHLVPGMRGLYSHVSERMRQDLADALQRRWEEAGGIQPPKFLPPAVLMRPRRWLRPR